MSSRRGESAQALESCVRELYCRDRPSTKTRPFHIDRIIGSSHVGMVVLRARVCVCAPHLWMSCVLSLDVMCSVSPSDLVQTRFHHTLVVVAPVFCHDRLAMERSRRPWEGHSRHDDKKHKKRDHGDDFDEFLKKKRRELADLKCEADRQRADAVRQRADAERLRSERNKWQNEIEKLRADIKSKDVELAHMEQQSERQMKRVRAALENVFEVMAAPPAMSEDGDSTDTSEAKDTAGDEDPPRPTLPEETPVNTADGPGEAAPGPEEEEEEGEAAKVQDEALERAANSTRTEISEISQALGGQ
jgi:hypothetical protein